jgi:hypothetical protein
MDFETAVSASKFEQGKNKAKMGVTTYDSCQREWDIQLLKTCFCNHDFEEINKIRLSEKMEEDVITWYYEKSGIFSVKSVYRLALQWEQEEKWETGKQYQCR